MRSKDYAEEDERAHGKMDVTNVLEIILLHANRHRTAKLNFVDKHAFLL